MPNPLPTDTQIKVKIYSEGRFLRRAESLFIRKQILASGVTFRDLRPQFLSVLKQWLLAAAVAKYGIKS